MGIAFQRHVNAGRWSVQKSQNDPRVLASQMPKALLLCGKKSSPDDPNLAKLLDFFGIPWIALGVGEIPPPCHRVATGASSAF